MIVAFEGIDGAGKRTQAEMLQERLVSSRTPCALLSFPVYGETQASKLITKYLNGEYGDVDLLVPHAMGLIFAMDRLESRQLITNLLRVNDVLILDRYVATNIAYQLPKFPAEEWEEHIDWIEHMEYELHGMPKADFTVYLDMPVDVSSELMGRRDHRPYTEAKKDIVERNTSYLRDCLEVYRDLATDSGWIRVDCVDDVGELRSVDDIHEDVWTGLTTRDWR